tara:strand:- start:2658 stop:2804 length:147 start_codon:yes stop_codon:yes gene_type:complete
MTQIPTDILRTLPMSTLLDIVSSRKIGSKTKLMANLVISQRFNQMGKK